MSTVQVVLLLQLVAVLAAAGVAQHDVHVPRIVWGSNCSFANATQFTLTGNTTTRLLLSLEGNENEWGSSTVFIALGTKGPATACASGALYRRAGEVGAHGAELVSLVSANCSSEEGNVEIFSHNVQFPRDCETVDHRCAMYVQWSVASGENVSANVAAVVVFRGLIGSLPTICVDESFFTWGERKEFHTGALLGLVVLSALLCFVSSATCVYCLIARCLSGVPK